MYLGEYEIDEYIDIVVTTHRFSSGAAYAATSIVYRVYEDGGTTEIISDTTMGAAFDSVTGLYYVRLQLTAAAGFEVGKNYQCLISATVDSVAAISWRTWRVKFPAVNAKQIGSTTQTGRDIGASVIVASGTVTTLTNLPAVTTDWLTAAGVKAEAVTKIQAGLATPTNITAGTITTATNLTNLPAIPTDWIAAGGVKADAVTKIQAGLATPTNITAGTITTATNLTNLPAIPTDWLTAGGVKADAVTKIQAGLATPTNITAASGVSLAADQAVNATKIGGTSQTPKDLGALNVTAVNTLAGHDPGSTIASASNVATAAADVSVDEIQASALADLFNTNSGTTYSAAVSGSPVKEIVDNAGGSSLTAGAIADAVWDEAIAGHLSTGSTGKALNSAGSAGDPWSTSLPGTYGAGTAGKLISDIGLKTDNLPADPASESEVEAAIAAIPPGGSGSGSIKWNYDLTDEDTSEPIADADVWVTTDSAGTNVIANGSTNQNGRVTFYLDAGIVYVFRQKTGYNFSNPDREKVS